MRTVWPFCSASSGSHGLGVILYLAMSPLSLVLHLAWQVLPLDLPRDLSRLGLSMSVAV